MPKKDSTDLLAGLATETSEKNADVLDLLDEIGEDDDAAPWGNPDDTEVGGGVQGLVVATRTTTSDYTDAPIPVVVVQTPEGEKLRISGYQSVLRNEINEKNPQIGDTFAVRYFGTKESKAGKNFHHYRVAVRRGTGAPVPVAAASKPPF